MQHAVLPVDDIRIGQRQRSDVADEHIASLAIEIRETELLHAPAVTPEHELIVGFCRLCAIKTLTVPYRYAGQLIQPGFVPVLVSHQTDPGTLFRLELMENLRRKNLSPMDEAKAIARLHEIRVNADSKWTKADTGLEVDDLRGTSPPRHPVTAAAEVGDAMLLQSFANDPDVAKARSRAEAKRIASKKLERELMASLGGMAQTPSSNYKIINGDAREILTAFPDNCCHGILCDPPYGISADEFGEQASAGHDYKDDEEGAIELASFILARGFNICLPDAHIYLFCDIRIWPYLVGLARPVGWMPFATPLIWHKPGLGHAPQPGYFGRRYECIFFAQKGNRKLSRSASDVFTHSSVKDKIHSAQKPVELISELLSLSFFPGEHVIDPCAGSGTIFRAAHVCKLKATGIEKSPSSFGLCQQAISELK